MKITKLLHTLNNDPAHALGPYGFLLFEASRLGDGYNISFLGEYLGCYGDNVFLLDICSFDVTDPVQFNELVDRLEKHIFAIVQRLPKSSLIEQLKYYATLSSKDGTLDTF